MAVNKGHVFISHGSEDRDEANALCDFIEARGIKTWIAPRNVRPGQDYSEQLQQAIEQCAAFVVLVTGKANTSPYVRAETEMAFSTNKPIFPVRQSDIQPAAGLAFFLKIRHWTDAFGTQRGANLDRLTAEVKTVVSMQTPAPEAELQPATPQAPAFPVPPPSSPTQTWASPVPAPPPASYSTTPGRSGLTYSDAVSDTSDERVRAYVGPNAPYYVTKWREMTVRSDSKGWNWAAFFLSIYWAAYRKMWAYACVGAIVVILLFLLGLQGRSAQVLNLILVLVVMGGFGVFGNELYRRQAMKAVEDPSLGGLDGRSALDRLALQGGVSWPAGIGIAAVVLIINLSLGAAMRQSAVTVAPAAAPAAAAEAVPRPRLLPPRPRRRLNPRRFSPRPPSRRPAERPSSSAARRRKPSSSPRTIRAPTKRRTSSHSSRSNRRRHAQRVAITRTVIRRSRAGVSRPPLSAPATTSMLARSSRVRRAASSPPSPSCGLTGTAASARVAGDAPSPTISTAP